MNGGPNMLYTHFTEELLGLQGVKITNIENSKKSITVYAELGYCGDWQSPQSPST